MKNLLLSILLLTSCTILSAQLPSYSDPDSARKVKNAEGLRLLRDGDVEKAIELLEESLRIRLRYFPEDFEMQFPAYTNLALAYKWIFDMDRAIENFDKAEELVKKYGLPESNLFYIYNNKIFIYSAKKELSLMKTYAKEAIEIGEKYHPNSVHGTYFNVALSYFRFNLIEQGKPYLDKALELASKDIEILNEFLEVAARPIQYSKREEVIRDFLARRKAILFKYFKNDRDKLLRYYLDNGIFLNDFGSPEEAYQSLIKGMDIITQEKEFNRSLMQQFYYELGKHYLRIDDYQQALLHFQQVLILLSDSFTNMDVHTNPDDVTNISFLIKDLFYFKVKALYKYYLQSKDYQYLVSAEQTLAHYEKFRNQLGSKESGIEDTKNIYVFANEFDFSIGEIIYSDLYRITGEQKYLEAAFSISERIKSNRLLNSLRSGEAINFGDIPAALIKEENGMRARMNYIQEELTELSFTSSGTDPRVRELERQQIQMARDYNRLILFFERNYPEYYKLKYSEQMIPLGDIRKKLKPDEVLVEYSMADSFLFSYVVLKDTVYHFTSKVEDNFRKKCISFYESIKLQNFSRDIRRHFNEYISQSHELYKILVEPIAALIKDKNIIFIPEAELSYIPFDALLTEEVKQITDEKPSYYNLPVLIRKQPVSVNYSATVLYGLRRKFDPTPGEVLAFAPDYSMARSRDSASNPFFNLARILGVQEEVKRIGGIVEADIMSNHTATEGTFRQKSGEYRVLHLAMHTILNDEEPLYSKLAFTPFADSTEDGLLHTYEIYNMNFNARMAVLSSCASGFGVLKEGEGFQSLARSFAYAGCPSILMTLWEVSDRSTIDIMERFYYYLDQGDLKSEALQKSKLDFLEKADQLKSNPYFWAGYMLIGDTSPLYDNEGWKRWYPAVLAGIVLLGGVGIVLFMRRKRKKRVA